MKFYVSSIDAFFGQTLFSVDERAVTGRQVMRVGSRKRQPFSSAETPLVAAVETVQRH